MSDNDVARRTCPLCGKVSKNVNSAKSHLWHCRKKASTKFLNTPALIERYGTCPKCKKIVTCRDAMKAHKSLCLRTCKYCDKVFTKSYVATCHELKLHNASRFLGQCHKCKMTFVEKSKLEAHIKLCIVKNVLHRFRSEEEMDRWIEQMQLETLSYFSYKGGKINRYGASFSYKLCQHANIKSSKNATARTTSRRRKVGTVPNYNCKARIAITHRGSEFFVKYFGKHNHPCEGKNLVYQPFPASYRQELIEKLASGVKPKILYREELEKQLERKKINPKPDKRDTLTLRYLKHLKSNIILNKAPFSRIPKQRFKNESSACGVRPTSSGDDFQEAYFEDADISYVGTTLVPIQEDPQYPIFPVDNAQNQDEEEDKLDILKRIQENHFLLTKYLEPSYLSAVPANIVKEVDRQMQKMLSIFKAHARLPVKAAEALVPLIKIESIESLKVTHPKPVCQIEEPKQITIVSKPPPCTPATLTTETNLLSFQKQIGSDPDSIESLKVANSKPVQIQSQNGVTKRIIIVGKPPQYPNKTLSTGRNVLMNQGSELNREPLNVINSKPVCQNENTKRIIIVRQPPQFTPTKLTPGRHLLMDHKQKHVAQVTVTK